MLKYQNTTLLSNKRKYFTNKRNIIGTAMISNYQKLFIYYIFTPNIKVKKSINNNHYQTINHNSNHFVLVVIWHLVNDNIHLIGGEKICMQIPFKPMTCKIYK